MQAANPPSQTAAAFGNAKRPGRNPPGAQCVESRLCRLWPRATRSQGSTKVAAAIPASAFLKRPGIGLNGKTSSTELSERAPWPGVANTAGNSTNFQRTARIVMTLLLPVKHRVANSAISAGLLHSFDPPRLPKMSAQPNHSPCQSCSGRTAPAQHHGAGRLDCASSLPVRGAGGSVEQFQLLPPRLGRLPVACGAGVPGRLFRRGRQIGNRRCV